MRNQTVCSRIWHLWNRPVAGLLSRDVVSGRVESSGWQAAVQLMPQIFAVSHAASLHVVCSRHVEFPCVLCESSVNDPPRWSISLAIGGSKHFAVGTLVWSTWDKTSARGTLWTSGTRQSTMGKKKKGCTLFYTQILFVFLGELSMRFLVTYR